MTDRARNSFTHTSTAAALTLRAIVVVASLYATTAAAQPTNDDCANATQVVAGTYVSDTTGATPDGLGCSFGRTPDVWFVYEATERVSLTTDLCAESTEVYVISAHSACPEEPNEDLLECGKSYPPCPDDLGDDFHDHVVVYLEPGERVWLRVTDRDDTGPFEINVVENRALDLGTLDGREGFVAQPSSFSFPAGDINGDGLADLVFCGIDCWVVLGKDDFPVLLDPTLVGGEDGFTFRAFGETVSSGIGGDINGDGLSDVVFTVRVDPGIQQIAVVFGSEDPYPPLMDASLLDGENGFVIEDDVTPNWPSALTVRSGGDLNDDGIEDLAVATSAWGPEEDGAVFVIYGSRAPFPARSSLRDLDGSNGIALQAHEFEVLGSDARFSDDVNGDGIDDLLVLAPSTNPFHTSKAYIVYGSSASLPPAIDLTTLDAEEGRTLIASHIGQLEYFARVITPAGDLNRDGLEDVLLAVRNRRDLNDNEMGEAYIVYGDRAGGDVHLGELDGTDGFSFQGVEYGFLGSGMHGNGDLNGDGWDDIAIGDPESWRTLSDGWSGAVGDAYIIHGPVRGADVPRDRYDLTDDAGLVILGADHYGSVGESVFISDDVNGDAIDDLLLSRGFNFWDGGFDRSFVVYGTTVGKYLVGDWNGDGRDDIAVREGSTVWMDDDRDGAADYVHTFGFGDSESQYLVGDWDGDGQDNLAVRRGARVLMDVDFDEQHDLEVFFGTGEEDEFFAADVNGDGMDDLVARSGLELAVDLWPWDGLEDGVRLYGGGDSEDQYLFGDWTGDGRQTPAVRRGPEIWMNADFDGQHDFIQIYGRGNDEDEYLSGDWDGDGREELAVRRGFSILMNADFDGQHDVKQVFGLGTVR